MGRKAAESKSRFKPESTGGPSPAGPPVLEARGLVLAWENSAPVVEGVDVVVHAGQTVCLVGKSGMGKTTILHALAGLLPPCEGRVMLHGEDVTGKPGRISYMLQKDLLLPNLTVIDNACLPLTLAGTTKANAREQARPLLARFGLADVAEKWPAQLSGGMRQRAAFLRTYLMGNDVVMLDEPFSALDAITRSDMRKWFRDEAHELGLSTLMITHDADEACLVADRILVLGSKGGGPSRMIGEVVPVRVEGAADYALTSEFLEAKSRVIALLQA